MTSWMEFAQQAPGLAAFGKAHFESGVAYLGTLRADGGPRVHPATPIIGEESFLFMEPTSPKGKDLHRDPRYALHCSVEDSSGGGGEFYVKGHAISTDNSHIREQAVRASSYAPRDRYSLFILTIEFALMNQYVNGNPTPQSWPASD